MSNANGEAADWFGQGGRSVPDLKAGLAVTGSQLTALRFGWRAIMEIAALANSRMKTCEVVFGEGSNSAVKAGAVLAAAGEAASYYEELLHKMETDLLPALRVCTAEEP